MVYKFQYNNDEERQKILADNIEKHLIEERNVTEGNFLIFTDIKPLDIEVQTIKEQLKTTQEALDFLLMGGM